MGDTCATSCVCMSNTTVFTSPQEVVGLSSACSVLWFPPPTQTNTSGLVDGAQVKSDPPLLLTFDPWSSAYHPQLRGGCWASVCLRSLVRGRALVLLLVFNVHKAAPASYGKPPPTSGAADTNTASLLGGARPTTRLKSSGPRGCRRCASTALAQTLGGRA